MYKNIYLILLIKIAFMVNEQDAFWKSNFGNEYSIRNNFDTNYKRVYEFKKYTSKITSIDLF